jgi:tetratricopeptide (TPR) repeat protein
MSQLDDDRLRVRAGFSFAEVKADFEGEFDAALDELARSVATAEAMGNIPLLVEGHLRIGFILYSMGELARAEDEFERCSALAADLGSIRDEARANVPRAVINYLRGEIDKAERLGEQNRAWLERTGETFFQIQNLISLAQYALARNDAVTAEERLREALPIALDEDTWYVAEIYRLLTDALILLDRLDDATQLVAFAARGAEDDHPYVRAANHMAEAALAKATGDVTTARTRHEDAIAVLEELGLPLELSQARLAYGRTLRDIGEPEAAREQFEAARDACARMGAKGLLLDVERELALFGSGAA